MSTLVFEPPGLQSPTGRFCTWLMLAESELARGVRARGWNLARQLWRERTDMHSEDEAIVAEWLDHELQDIFSLAAHGKNPVLREEALKVRVAVRRPDQVNVHTITHALQMLYRARSPEVLLDNLREFT